MLAKFLAKTLLFLTKDEHKDQHKTTFERRFIHALAKSATSRGNRTPKAAESETSPPSYPQALPKTLL